jgi:hypothetical protein
MIYRTIEAYLFFFVVGAIAGYALWQILMGFIEFARWAHTDKK